MRRLLVCANPAASGFTGGLHREVLARLRAEFDVESEWPKTPADTRRVSAQAAAEGFDVVVAMGGDGVVHHVVDGLAGSETSLGIVPAGTTNVLARLIGIPNNARRAVDLIAGPTRPRPVPTAALTLASASGVEHRRATFSTGMGFDAEVVEVAEQEPFRKYRFGGVHYARSAATVVWNNFADREPTVTVTDGTRSATAVAVLVQLHEKYTYFGRVPLGFGAHTPGTATVLVATELPRRRIAPLLIGTATGRDLQKIDGVEVWEQVTSLTMTADAQDVAAQADGELLGMPSSMVIEVDPTALRVIAPAPGKRRFTPSES